MKIEPVKELGFYLYNGIPYTSRVAVLDKIIENKDYSPNVSLYFSDDVYSKIDWTIEPTQTLDQLYMMRAKQIRETYDYVLVFLSGGVDSVAIIDAFLKANLHIDEVVTTFPTRYSSQLPKLENPESHPLGILLEYEHAALPVLQEISIKSPKTKITSCDISDWFDEKHNNDNFMADNSEFIITRQMFQILTIAYHVEYLDKKMSDMGQQKIAAVWGSDKPNFYEHKNKLYFHFIDIGRLVPGMYAQTATNYDLVMFFWSRQFPLIPIKQGHIFKRHIEKSRKLREIFNSTPSLQFKESDIMKKIIYPNSYNPNLFQKKVKNDDDGIFTVIYGQNGQDNGLEAKHFYQNKYKLFYDNLDLSRNKHYFNMKNKKIIINSRSYNLGTINEVF